MLKIRFANTVMAERAVREGLSVVYQRIPPDTLRRKYSLSSPPATIATAMNIKHNHVGRRNSQFATVHKKGTIKVTAQRHRQSA